MTPQEIKAACEAIWRGELEHSGHITGYHPNLRSFPGRACGEYVSKEARKWRSQFAMYNKRLAPVILAGAAEITKDDDLTHYVFKSEPKPFCEEAPKRTRKPRTPRIVAIEPEPVAEPIPAPIPARDYRAMLTARLLKKAA